MVLPFLWSIGDYAFYGDKDQPIIIFCFTISMIGGFSLSFIFHSFGKNGKGQIFKREAFLLVTLAWSVGALIAALPFYCFGILGAGKIEGAEQFSSLLDCIFEGISCLTTTGATILTNIQALPKGILLWRAFVPWLGGLGIVMIFVAVLPMIAGGGRRMFQAEATGIGGNDDATKIQEKVRTIWLIYLFFTVLQFMIMKFVQPDLSFFG